MNNIIIIINFREINEWNLYIKKII
jgi:hypothetical protein